MERFTYQSDRYYKDTSNGYYIGVLDQLDHYPDPVYEVRFFGNGPSTGLTNAEVFPIGNPNPQLRDKGVIFLTPPYEGATPYEFYPYGSVMWWWQPPMVPSGWVNVPTSFEYKLSQSTQGWSKLKKFTVAELFERRDRLTLREPRKPRYFPLKLRAPTSPVLLEKSVHDFKGFVKPIRRKRETADDYSKRVDHLESLYIQRLIKRVKLINLHRRNIFDVKMRKYQKVVSSQQARVAQHREIFERRLAKYERRRLAYELWLKKQKLFGRKDLVFKRRAEELPENPFISVKMNRIQGDPSGAYSSYTSNEGGFVRTWFYPVNFYFRDGVNHESATKAFVRGFATSTSNSAWEAFSDLETKVISKIYDKINRNQVHLGNLIAERAQTYKMILDTYKALHSLILLKKGFLKSIVSILNNPRELTNKISNGILAWKFGVEPLANDLATALRVLAEGRGNGVVSVRSNSKRRVTNLRVGSFIFSGEVEISMVCKATVDNDFARLASDTGLLDPSQILWEVTPWSFVLDWFIPIGNYIQSLTSTVGLSFKTGTRKIRLKGRFDFVGNALDQNYGAVYDPLRKLAIGDSLGGIWEGELKRREVLRSWPDSNRILAFKNPFSLWHSVESISLMIQKLLKK